MIQHHKYFYYKDCMCSLHSQHSSLGPRPKPPQHGSHLVSHARGDTGSNPRWGWFGSAAETSNTPVLCGSHACITWSAECKDPFICLCEATTANLYSWLWPFRQKPATTVRSRSPPGPACLVLTWSSMACAISSTLGIASTCK